MTGSSRPHEIVERALELSRTDGCVVIADEKSEANLRWASNTLTTNGVDARPQAHRDRHAWTARGAPPAAWCRASAVTADELEPLVRAAEAAARGRRPGRGRAAAGRPGAPAVGWVHRAAGGDLAPTCSRRSRPRSARRSPRARAGGRRAVRLRRPRGDLDLPGHLHRRCGCGTTSRPARWRSTRKSPDRTRSAWAGAATRDFARRRPAGARRRPGRSGWPGRSARSTCPRGGTRRCCRRPRSPT